MQCNALFLQCLSYLRSILHSIPHMQARSHSISSKKPVIFEKKKKKNCDTVSAPLSSLHTVGSRDHVVATDRQAVERLMMPPLLSCVVQCRLQRTSPDPDDCSWNPVYATLFGTVPMTVRSSHTNTSRALLFLFTTFFSYY